MSETFAQVEAARIAAVEAERKRFADEADAIAKTTAAREADKAHKSAILRTAKEALMQHAGLSEESAKKAIRAIYDGNVPAVKMEF